MFSIQVFAPTETEITTFVEPGTGVCWFHAGSMAETLEFANPYRYLPTVLSGHEYKEVKAPGAVGRPSLYVREEAVYLLIMKSKSAYASEFQRWLAYDVLPAIRKTGSFGNVPNVESGGSEFWQLIDGAIARGLEPEAAIDLHHRFQSPVPTTTKIKTTIRGQIHSVELLSLSKTHSILKADAMRFVQDSNLFQDLNTVPILEVWELAQRWQQKNKVELVRSCKDIFPMLSACIPGLIKEKHPKTRRATIRKP